MKKRIFHEDGKKIKHCEFEYEGVKCPTKEIVGIARCKYLCKTHFSTVRKDNIHRFKKGQDIPKELVFPDHLRISQTFSKTRKITKDERGIENKWE